eukprot:Lithocolla_globosa_v1_NODE_2400_length_2023_cov_4.945122.p1 type:complete len:302 gc:universal NODE_2400_length_2023_cov_4.945122:1602-697(-)
MTLTNILQTKAKRLLPKPDQTDLNENVKKQRVDESLPGCKHPEKNVLPQDESPSSTPEEPKKKVLSEEMNKTRNELNYLWWQQTKGKEPLVIHSPNKSLIMFHHISKQLTDDPKGRTQRTHRKEMNDMLGKKNTSERQENVQSLVQGANTKEFKKSIPTKKILVTENNMLSFMDQGHFTCVQLQTMINWGLDLPSNKVYNDLKKDRKLLVWSETAFKTVFKGESPYTKKTRSCGYQNPEVFLARIISEALQAGELVDMHEAKLANKTVVVGNIFDSGGGVSRYGFSLAGSKTNLCHLLSAV